MYLILFFVGPWAIILYMFRKMLNWRHLTAMLLLFFGMPVIYAFTGIPYLMILPFVGAWILIDGWVPKRT